MEVKVKLIALILIGGSFGTLGQTVTSLKPTLGYLVDKDPQGEIKYLNEQKQCTALWERQNAGARLTDQEQKILDECAEDRGGYYDVLGVGCSWYCGGGGDTQTSSSELQPANGISYAAHNAHDLSYKTAWVEGASGYGIGEYLIYSFPPTNPRITKIIIVNGYAKSKKAWSENSRVKVLKMYVNEKPFAVLNLEDTRREQAFAFEPIGNSDRADWNRLKSGASWTMKFEIVDIYKGEKYDDTAITEIYFDGIDVH